VELEYRIKACDGTTGQYGNCERCGKRCEPHYKQQWRKIGQKSSGWIDVGFGHIECLQNLDWKNAPVVEI